ADAVCNQPNGSVNLTVSGGTSPYTYAWSNGATTQDILNVAAGTYTVTVTQANGCSSTQSPVVDAVTPPTVTVVIEHSYCGEEGLAEADVLNGTSPYQYLWIGGDTTASVSGGAGTYAVTVTDADGCTTSNSAAIQAYPSPTLSASANPAFCGNPNGSANLSIASSSPVTSIVWSIGLTLEDLDGVVSGTYMVTVTDINSCTAELTVTIADTASALTQLNVETTSASCGENNGTIEVDAVGADPLQYLWSTGTSTTSITNLPPGNYELSITDVHGCLFVDTISVDEIVATAAADISGPATTPVDSINAYSIASQPGTVVWDVGSGLMSGQGTNAISVVWTTVGTQTITVMVTDVGGCVAYDTLTVMVNNVNGVEQSKFINAHWVLFPNPANESVNLRIDGISAASYVLEIFAADGRLVAKKKLDFGTGLVEHTIRLEHFIPGAYYLKLTDGRSSEGKPFTILR
ncbi:MAG TPA: T9SS type A sorting domain-containing protein, partial [Chitinophagales bacterium]|nr:T9SS type A sorting domain-containing protein [Chitinophagales bacterium]